VRAVNFFILHSAFIIFDGRLRHSVRADVKPDIALPKKERAAFLPARPVCERFGFWV